MGICYDVPDHKRLRVIVDTDAACEADDPFAIAHALLCPKLMVKAIFAEQFGAPETTRRSYEEIVTIVRAMGKDVPVLMGEEGSLSQIMGKPASPAAQFLVEEALQEDPHPLYVLCLGAITNVASAMKLCPEIAKRMTVVWIGGQNPDDVKKNHREFNAGNDIEAINLVVSSGVEFWQIPNSVYSTMKISLAEIQRRISPCGEIGKHLFENLADFNASERAFWVHGESWSLGDSPAVGVALEPDCGRYVIREAPVFEADTTYRFEKGRPMIRVYTSIDSRFILEDMICKLELNYGNNPENPSM